MTVIDPVYLDYAATTPVAPEVAELMADCLCFDGNFGNPASRSHVFGWRAEEAVENARSQVANLIGADPREIVWTGGATESSNLSLKGAQLARRQQGVSGGHVVTSSIEHKSVLDVCQFLQAEGIDITYVAPEPEGRVDTEKFLAAIRPDTFIVSLMHANNETGAVNDIACVGQYCRENNVLMHVDAAQTLGKIPIDVKAMNIDLMSMSAHKIYGPKGSGALYARRHPSVKIEALLHGGGHERGLRSGTLATHQIAGFGQALVLAKDKQADDYERARALREQFIQGLKSLSGWQLNGTDQGLPGIVNVSFADVDGETLLMSLRELAISSGSACTSATVEPSYVLRAMGLTREAAHNSLRFSFGRYTSSKDIALAVEKIHQAVSALRPPS